MPGGARPDYADYASIAPEYIIGSIHFVAAPDGARVPVDHAPELLAAGIREHFGGRAEAFVRAYFAQQREMVASFDFDVVGHLDLVRKFNAKHPYFDEGSGWYRDELERTADAVAASGKVAEVNTGAISRGWLDDAYPSADFRARLRARGVRFAFDRFGDAETYVASLDDVRRLRLAGRAAFLRRGPRGMAEPRSDMI